MKGRIALLFEPTTMRILAPLLLVALLFCHGFLSAPQHVSGPPDRSHIAEEHSSHAPEDPGMRLEHSGCVAVLISDLFGEGIGLLLGGARMWGGSAVSRPPKWWSFPPLLPHPARGPMAPLLQVFRL